MLYEKLGEEACKKLLIDRGLNSISTNYIVKKASKSCPNEFNKLIEVVQSGYGSKAYPEYGIEAAPLTDETFRYLCKQLIQFTKEEEE